MYKTLSFFKKMDPEVFLKKGLEWGGLKKVDMSFLDQQSVRSYNLIRRDVTLVPVMKDMSVNLQMGATRPQRRKTSW